MNSQTIKENAVYNETALVAPIAPPRAAVSAYNLTRRYGDGDSAVEAVSGVSLEVPTGQFTAIMGPSGSGKSTLMHLLAGLDRPTEGTVEIAGEDITEMGDKQLTLLRRKHIGFVFQAFNLVPTLNAEENVTLPLSIAGRKLDRGWIDTVIGRVGLDDRRSHRPAELSGGQ
jgi:putative ABC transport system ATP-binding protein